MKNRILIGALIIFSIACIVFAGKLAHDILTDDACDTHEGCD